MSEDKKANIVCAIIGVLGFATICMAGAKNPAGTAIFLLIIALIVTATVSAYRKERAGKRQRDAINRKFKAELEELRKEGVDT